MSDLTPQINRIILLVIMLSLTACSFAPHYQRPLMNIPIDYKEAGEWLPANPTYANNYRGPWWQVFGDPDLNALEERVTIANQNLQVAFAQYNEALAAVKIARSDLFPTVTGLLDTSRIRDSETTANPPPKILFNDIFLGSELVYEIDLWGRIRNSIAASANRARASAADLAGVDLSMHAELAQDYFLLRGADREQRVLDAVVIAYTKALTIVRNRHNGGIAPISDVEQAETTLENAKTLAAATRLSRAQYEHAIAVLIGEAPAHFSLPVATPEFKLVTAETELPSTLLERRPDIAAAERRVQAANAQIGVARAAFFPVVSLSTSLGFESQSLGKLFSLPSLVWSLGPPLVETTTQPTAVMTLFDGGKLHGQLALTNATYCEAVANYRQTVLTAFQQVEDSLVALHQLENEYHTQTRAAFAAKQALIQARYRYIGGIITYLEVVVTENTALQTELTALQIVTQRQIASIQLIRALGGGFVMDTTIDSAHHPLNL